MKKTALIILSLVALFLGIFLYFQFFSYKEIEIKGDKFKAETAVSVSERERGLSGRENLCQKCAMLFIFERPGNYSFWMKGMKFPLDIIWILDHRVVYMAKDISPNFKQSIRPQVLADRVLEINGGLAEKYSLKIGDEIKY